MCTTSIGPRPATDGSVGPLAGAAAAAALRPWTTSDGTTEVAFLEAGPEAVVADARQAAPTAQVESLGVRDHRRHVARVLVVIVKNLIQNGIGLRRKTGLGVPAQVSPSGTARQDRRRPRAAPSDRP